MRFALALHTDDSVRYGVTVPDLPGCFSAGDTLDDAIDSAREAIDVHCEALADAGCDGIGAREITVLKHFARRYPATQHCRQRGAPRSPPNSQSYLS